MEFQTQFPDEASCWAYLRQIGRGVGKTGVAIAVERRTRTAGAVRLAVIPRATTAVLTSFVQDSIQPQETTVFTDAWGSYAALRRLGIDHRPREGGRGHQSVHLLPRAHMVFGNLKTWLRGPFHGVSPTHLQRYWTSSSSASIGAGARPSSSSASCTAHSTLCRVPINY